MATIRVIERIAVAVALLVACGPPPPPPPKTAQEVLVARVPPVAVEGGPGIRDGATVRFGSTSFVVERVTSDAEPRDLTRETILAATDLAKRAGIGDAQKVDDALTLIDRLGTIIAGQDQRTDFTAEAKVDERPYRISCATNVALRGIDERARPSLSCAIVAAAAHHAWKLEAKTVGGKSQALSHPVTLTSSTKEESFWMNRPEKRSLVRGGSDYSAFIVGKDGGGGPNVGRLVVSGSRAAYLDASAVAPASADALRIAFAILTLVEWPEPRR